MLTFERASELLKYDPEAGLLYRKVSLSNNSPLLAGGRTDGGRLNVHVDGVRYKYHRVCWLLHYGEWPSAEVDHIDGDPSNNAIANLRLADRSSQAWNTRRRTDNTSGFKGIDWRKEKKLWRARVNARGKTVYVEHFRCLGQAIKRRREEAAKHHGKFVRHG